MDELKKEAAAVAEVLMRTESGGPLAGGGGSRQRGLPDELRQRFVAVRSALVTRGIFDPMLARFDSASAPPASNAEIGERLARVVEALG